MVTQKDSANAEARKALFDLVRIKFALLIPGIGSMNEILDDISKEFPVTRSDRAELCELAETIAAASIKFAVIAGRVSGVNMGHVM
ncbi:MAG TPA: hypothetical protein VM260_19260 [Pirellula sp.]|nr:hypothetical protein [Pirellula sp.]